MWYKIGPHYILIQSERDSTHSNYRKPKPPRRRELNMEEVERRTCLI